MSTEPEPHPAGRHRYTSVVEGVALANDFASSRLSMSEFARQRGVSFNMVKYWSARARRLAAASDRALVEVASVSPAGVIEAASMPALPAPAGPGSRVAAVTSAPSIEVRLPNGVRIGVAAGFSAEVLSQVIACVSGRPC